MDKEIKAIRKVEDFLANTDRLKAYLQQGEKEPSWDGHLYLFKDKTKSKDGLLRIPTQVKGTECDHKNKTRLKYQIEKFDLENYFNDGGCIYLVVCLKNSSDYKIYYTSLLPVKIKGLLKKIENNKRRSKNKNRKVTIELKILPENEDELIAIVMNFVYNRDRQYSLRNNVLPLEKIMEDKKEFTFTNYVSSPDKLQDLSSLIGEEIYGYVNENNVEYPIELLTIKGYSETIKSDVLVGEKQFYSNITIFNNGKTKTKIIGNSFKITENLDDLSNKTSFSYNVKGTLKQRIYDIKFIIEVFTNDSLIIQSIANKDEYHLKNAIDSKTIDILKKKLNDLQLIDKTLTELNIKKDLELDKFSKQDWGSLSLFKRTFIDRQTVEKINPSDHPFSILKCGNIQILVAIEKCDNGYIMKDYRDSKTILMLKQDDKEYILPKEIGLINTGALNIDNFDISDYLDIIKTIRPELNYFTTINYNLLGFISKFDSSGDEKYYKIAIGLNNWLSENYQQFYIVNMINNLQLKKRKQSLSIDDKSLLYDFIKHASQSEQKDTITIYCSAILLDDYEMLKNIEMEMSKEELENIKKLPIEFLNKEKNNG